MLQQSPILVGSSCTGDDDDRDREFPARAPNFRDAFPDVNELVSRRLVAGCAESRRLRELPH